MVNKIVSIIKKYKIAAIGILVGIAVILCGIISYFWYENTYYISTNDAVVGADVVNVNTQIQGKLLEFDINEGDEVNKDEILARQEVTNTPDSSIDSSLVRAPISGIVVKKQSTQGEFKLAGQTIATVADEDNVYVTANIDEKEIQNVKVGQAVTVKLDEFNGKKFNGKVKSIGLVSQNGLNQSSKDKNGEFKKVNQKVPVKIQFNKTKGLVLGTNASVKIRVK
ncbi:MULTISPECIES: HlyD family secretion protein [Clostridium]|uniref:Multidrug resistance protein MdtN n=2 Tax=Clostridium TaxID=1485 RepID=A0A162L902_9CLOT|nr:MULTISPECIES: efflux RND transporter periplasmic adaptor subunit [Clostridium]AGY76900.1 efflux RND transporter periplasmic adaptor subunit [Clostridium autoethanogenum DSM 10061]ALU37046.1 'HlyD family secretion protein [Clostridium autoethanogenum DSM 10061]OAA92802.1 Multidrug resistance protein MdtN [Clostridium coskatii]OBR92153.1 multidrug resistance protein MdtN [Clostridium coskatii]OVY48742.1 Multidrug resistance protein MdtN [Clostridium autoethanogenum]